MIVSAQSEGAIRWRVLSRIHLAVKVANEIDYQFCLFRHFYPLNFAPLAFDYLCARRKNNKYLA